RTVLVSNHQRLQGNPRCLLYRPRPGVTSPTPNGASSPHSCPPRHAGADPAPGAYDPWSTASSSASVPAAPGAMSMSATAPGGGSTTCSSGSGLTGCGRTCIPGCLPRPSTRHSGEPDHHGFGRSRGGWSTKIHVGIDADCGVMSVVITPGQAGDGPQMVPVLEKIRVPSTGRGRPRKRPERVLADKAYSSRANRKYLRSRGIKATISQPKDQVANRRRRGSAGGRPPAFDTAAYRRRNTVERGIN